MYAVIFEGGLLYLGTDQQAALDSFSSKPGATLRSIESLDKLKELGVRSQSTDRDPVEQLEEELSDAAQKLVSKLDEWGINAELKDKLYENSEKVIAEVRHIGIKGMKTVGDGFVALGDLLRNAGDSGNVKDG